MAETAEEKRGKAAEATAKANWDRELARRKAMKDAQAKANQTVHRPLVG